MRARLSSRQRVFEPLLQLEQVLDALGRRHATPRRPRRGRRADRGIHFLRRRQRHVGQRHARGRIGDVQVIARVRALPGAADVVEQLGFVCHWGFPLFRIPQGRAPGLARSGRYCRSCCHSRRGLAQSGR
jgi:hypothetical protein